MIHFAYSGYPDSGKICAPSSITHHVYHYLKSKDEVTYHEFRGTDDITLDDNDIYIGHPTYTNSTVTNKTIRNNRKGRRVLISPYHHAIPEINLPIIDLVHISDKFLAITGQYWFDTISGSAFADCLQKMVRVDMAVNQNDFPYLKGEFNPKGHRRILYIGRNSPVKNIPLLYSIAQQLPKVEFWAFGITGINLPNVRLMGRRQLNGELARLVCEACDFSIITSISDANPTTILETASWGLIPISTKQCGYYEGDLVYNIPLQADRAVAKIKDLLDLDSDFLKERSINVSQIVAKQYNWDVFCNTVWNAIKV